MGLKHGPELTSPSNSQCYG